jgi:hypothetical protein
MLFIVFFVVGALALPVTLDSFKNGSDNIFLRSGRDLYRYSVVREIVDYLQLKNIKFSEQLEATGMVLCVIIFGLFGLGTLKTLFEHLTQFFLKR